MPKVEHLLYGDRKVFTVSAFNRGIGMHLGRLPHVWIEGELTELRRNPAWANVFLTLKDPKTAATLAVTIARRTYDRLELELDEGETVHVAGRAELFEQKARARLPRDDDRAARARRPPAGAGAAEAKARRRGLVRERTQAPAAASSARGGDPDRSRRRRTRGPRGDDRLRASRPPRSSSASPGCRGKALRRRSSPASPP